MKKIIAASLISLLISCSSNSKTTFKIDYEKFELDNGLTVIMHQDKSDPLVAMATVVHVGSNREKPGRTGFAHFFEHVCNVNYFGFPCSIFNHGSTLCENSS